MSNSKPDVSRAVGVAVDLEEVAVLDVGGGDRVPKKLVDTVVASTPVTVVLVPPEGNGSADGIQRTSLPDLRPAGGQELPLGLVLVILADWSPCRCSG